MASEAKKTLSTLVSGKDQDKDSISNKPSDNLVERRSKRKASTAEGPAMKKPRTDGVTHSVQPVVASVSGTKRKADTDEESPNKKFRGSKDTDISESSSVVFVGVIKKGNTTKKSSSDLILVSSSSSSSSSAEDEMYDHKVPIKTSRAEFEAKYTELGQIGKGGFGAVNAGYRKSDLVPVAIKHVPRETAYQRQLLENGHTYRVIPEVVNMVQAAGGCESPGESAAIALLDCFDLGDDIVLVMERPPLSTDLYKYCKDKGGYLQEDEAKIILKQLVDASIEMHDNGVFHRDIKLSNILVEHGSLVPRARIIDFGCGSLERGNYYLYAGTFAKAPPEYFCVREYQSRPTTVWQLGALLYDMLDDKKSFDTRTYMKEGLEIKSDLSTDCKDFLQMCLVKDPKIRATLEQLKLHPWLQSSRPHHLFICFCFCFCFLLISFFCSFFI